MSIGQEAFEYCFEIKTIDLPRNVESIGDYAFHNCGLESIVIPSSVKKIGKGVFVGSSSLESIFCETTEKTYPSLKCIAKKTKVYYYSETKPLNDGYYWRYVDGKPKAWDCN